MGVKQVFADDPQTERRHARGQHSTCDGIKLEIAHPSVPALRRRIAVTLLASPYGLLSGPRQVFPAAISPYDIVARAANRRMNLIHRCPNGLTGLAPCGAFACIAAQPPRPAHGLKGPA